MTEENLTSDERGYALNREDAWRKYKIQIERDYEASEDKASIISAAQIYIYENEASLDPIIQGRLSAYEDFLGNLSLAS